MKASATFLVLALATVGCATTDALAPAEPAMAGDEMMRLSPEEMMAMMIEAGTPGEHHAALAAGAGNWDVTYEYWMEPGGEPSKATATATYRLIMGGRYALEEFHSEFDGAPFEGMLIMGYDNVREQFQSVWIDNFGTGLHIQRGKRDASGVRQMRGKNFDLMTPKGRPMRSEQNYTDPDHFEMKMFDTLPDGTEWISMSFEYTRAAD